ncbi:MAG TPA: hypothetical protein VIO16_11315, partial [Dehalococcoidia bacterium]
LGQGAHMGLSAWIGRMENAGRELVAAAIPTVPAFTRAGIVGGFSAGGGQTITFGDINITGADQKTAREIADEVGAVIAQQMRLR